MAPLLSSNFLQSHPLPMYSLPGIIPQQSIGNTNIKKCGLCPQVPSNQRDRQQSHDVSQSEEWKENEGLSAGKGEEVREPAEGRERGEEDRASARLQLQAKSPVGFSKSLGWVLRTDLFKESNLLL